MPSTQVALGCEWLLLLASTLPSGSVSSARWWWTSRQVAVDGPFACLFLLSTQALPASS